VTSPTDPRCAATRSRETEVVRVALLEDIKSTGKTWAELAPRYGVTNPDPPWKTSLEAMCECLALGGALPALERRHAEDRLGEAVYPGTPAPERQLLALVHTMLCRGIVDEADLARRINAVRARFEASQKG
jgi:hypothetical protein